MQPAFRVVVVDDDPDWLELISRCLAVPGWTLHAEKFSNASESLHYLRRETVELIITDLHMPNLDGFTFIEMVRLFDPTTPIILISSSESAEKEALACGANAFIRKGALKRLLPAVVAELIQGAQRGR